MSFPHLPVIDTMMNVHSVVGGWLLVNDWLIASCWNLCFCVAQWCCGGLLLVGAATEQLWPLRGDFGRYAACRWWVRRYAARDRHLPAATRPYA